MLHSVADSMGLVSVDLTQSAPKADILYEIMRIDSQWAVQGHSRLPTLASFDSPYVTSYWFIIPTGILSRTVSELLRRIGEIIAYDSLGVSV